MTTLFLIFAMLGTMAVYLQAGEWAAIAALVLMMLLHEFGHWLLARWFGFRAPRFSIGFGSWPRLRLGRAWGTEFHLTPWLAGGYADIDHGSDELRAACGLKRLAVIVSGVAVNFALAFVLMLVLLVCFGKQTNVADGISVQHVFGSTSAAREAGLKPGDKILRVDGHPVKSYEDLHRELLVHADGSTADITVQRHRQTVRLAVIPDARGRIGVSLHYDVKSTYTRVRPSAAVWLAAVAVYDMSAQFLSNVLMILHILPVPAHAPAGSGAAHGLWSMVQLGAVAFRQGVYSFLSLVAYFSINLAFFNIMPVPGFDGGDLLYFAYEKVTGKTVSRKVKSKLGQIVLAIVVAVMVYAMFNDIFHPVA